MFDNTLADMAKRAATRDNIDDAVNAMLAELRADAELLAKFTDELLTRAVRGMIHDARHVYAISAKRATPAKPCQRNGATLGVVGELATATLLGMRFGNQVLADMTGAELRPVAEREREVGQGHLRVATFLDSLAERVPERGKVKNFIKEPDARAIWEGAGELVSAA